MVDRTIRRTGTIRFEYARTRLFALRRPDDDVLVATVDDRGQWHLWDRGAEPVPFLTDEHLTRFWRMWWAGQVISGIGFAGTDLVIATADDVVLPGVWVMPKVDLVNRDPVPNWPDGAGPMGLRLARLDDENGLRVLGRSGAALFTGPDDVGVLDPDGTVRRWRRDHTYRPPDSAGLVRDWRPLPELRLPFSAGHPARLMDAAPDASWLLAGPGHPDPDQPCWLLDLQSGECRALPGLRRGDVVARHGTELAVASADGQVRRLSVDQAADPDRFGAGTLVARVDGPAITALHLLADGRILAGDAGGSVLAWERDGELVRAGGPQHTGPVVALTARMRPTTLARLRPGKPSRDRSGYGYSLAEDGVVRRWNLYHLAGRLHPAAIEGSGQLARLRAMDAAGTRIVAEDRHGQLQVLDITDGRVVDDGAATALRAELSAGTRPSPDGRHELTVSERTLIVTRGGDDVAWLANARRAADSARETRAETGSGGRPAFCDARFSLDGLSVYAILARPDAADPGLWHYDLVEYPMTGGGRPSRRIYAGECYHITPVSRLHLRADGAMACVELGWPRMIRLDGGEHLWVDLKRSTKYPFAPAVLSGDLRTIAWPADTGEIAVGTWDGDVEDGDDDEDS